MQSQKKKMYFYPQNFIYKEIKEAKGRKGVEKFLFAEKNKHEMKKSEKGHLLAKVLDFQLKRR